MNQHVNADTENKDVDVGTTCVAVFGSGIGGVDLHSEDDLSSEDDPRELFAEYDSCSNECDVHHCQKI